MFQFTRKISQFTRQIFQVTRGVSPETRQISVRTRTISHVASGVSPIVRLLFAEEKAGEGRVSKVSGVNVLRGGRVSASTPLVFIEKLLLS